MTKEEAKHFSEVFKSAADGKSIQYKAKDEEFWKDLSLDTWKFIDMNYYEFRIKPEPKYRPYANAEEFLKAQKEHGPHIRSNKSCYFLPDRISEDRILWKNISEGFNEKTYEELVSNTNNYDWQDGSKIGVLEEQL